jgi:hypothetical protein
MTVGGVPAPPLEPLPELLLVLPPVLEPPLELLLVLPPVLEPLLEVLPLLLPELLVLLTPVPLLPELLPVELDPELVLPELLPLVLLDPPELAVPDPLLPLVLLEVLDPLVALAPEVVPWPVLSPLLPPQAVRTQAMAAMSIPLQTNDVLFMEQASLGSMARALRRRALGASDMPRGAQVRARGSRHLSQTDDLA